MAKNIITVAAADTGSNIEPFSSAGPLYDGRLAPQITALGANGTSEAAALVSGAAAVLQQVYKDSTMQISAPASLIKAFLFTTANDIGNKGIDYRSGFGLLDIYSAIKCLQQKKYDSSRLVQSQVWTKSISLPAQAANLKVTLAWTDTSSSVNNNKALVNDLDIELTETSSGTVYKPWGLSIFPHADSLQKLAVRKRDSLNTAEQVSIDLPAAGVYQIKVRGTKIFTANNQPFHIAYTWDTLNILNFINPIYPGDIDRDENPVLKIKWRTAVADLNTTGNLSVSYDDGASWQIIAPNIKVAPGFFNWTIPDMITPAQFRMVCSFGTFFSERFVIAPLTKINVDYLCPDSMRLSWQKNIFATSYKIFVLGDTAFIKPIINTTDTFVVLHRNLYPENIYAAEPILPSGYTAPRSDAIDVRNQGVNCYYRTLLAESAGDSIRLTLQLSIVNTIDSIIFEKVDANDVFIKQVARVIPSAGQFSYINYDNDPSAGLNYYRVKIWVKGSFVYTETVYAIHNGEKNVLVYPNPVLKGQMLKFSFREKFGNSTIQITDITGRVMGNYTGNVFAEIKTTFWASGIYLYKLLSEKGKTEATGKFIIP